MVETRTYQVFSYSELSDEAKERARYDHCVACGYSWADEAISSLKKLAEYFGGRMSDWQISWDEPSRSFVEFDMPEMSKAEIRRLLKELGTYNRHTLKGHGDCKLTGYCMDESAIDGFRWAFYRNKETDLGELMQAAFHTWMKACNEDYEYQYSDEAFAETCEANEYKFTEDGELD